MAVADRRPVALRPREIGREMGLSREKMGYVMSVSAKTIENWERRDQASCRRPCARSATKPLCRR